MVNRLTAQIVLPLFTLCFFYATKSRGVYALFERNYGT
jgi:hypothetical protein